MSVDGKFLSLRNLVGRKTNTNGEFLYAARPGTIRSGQMRPGSLAEFAASQGRRKNQGFDQDFARPWCPFRPHQPAPHPYCHQRLFAKRPTSAEIENGKVNTRALSTSIIPTATNIDPFDGRYYGLIMDYWPGAEYNTTIWRRSRSPEYRIFPDRRWLLSHPSPSS